MRATALVVLAWVAWMHSYSTVGPEWERWYSMYATSSFDDCQAWSSRYLQTLEDEKQTRDGARLRRVGVGIESSLPNGTKMMTTMVCLPEGVQPQK